MSGQGAGIYGLSVSSWEWLAAITLVVVACASAIFLKIRNHHYPRVFRGPIQSLGTIIDDGFDDHNFIGVSLIGVIYAGALTLTC